jgi:polynucleotide 5'-hydroxyl-kinase GRC3/NOL9
VKDGAQNNTQKPPTAMANDDAAAAASIETEWSPLAPSSAATAIGWKTKKSNKRSKSPKRKRQTPSDPHFPRKRPCPSSVPAAAASDVEQSSQPPLVPSGPLNKQDSLLNVDAEAKEQCDSALPDGVSVKWQGATAVLTFTKHPLHVCLLGRAELHVTKGILEVLGYRLDKNASEPVEIESPAWTSAITIVALECDTIVQVHSIRQIGTEQTFSVTNPAHDNVRPTMIPSSWKTAMDRVVDDIVTGPSSTETKNVQETDTNVNNTDAHGHTRIVVCGAKHVGKSTCIRYAVHRLLSSPSVPVVALLDCDAGQPEMSPPGMLTLTLIHKPLLSPPHHHMVLGEASLVTKQHANACFYGHVSSKADPSLYLQCISKLLQSYTQVVKEDYDGDESKLPLLVNMDGWVKGMGFEILSAALNAVQPNHVIQLLGEVRSKVFDLTNVLQDGSAILHEAHSYRSSSVTHESSISVAPVAAIQSSMYRSLRLCTYFMKSPEIWDRIEFGQYGIGDYECEIGQTLASMEPYAVSMDSVQYGTIRGVDNTACDLGVRRCRVGCSERVHCWFVLQRQ